LFDIFRGMDISKKNARRGIPVSPKLHTKQIQTGLAIGYRRGKTGGYWSARRHVQGQKYTFWAIAEADDTLAADGISVLSYDQAAEKARKWWAEQEAIRKGDVLPGMYTVAMAMGDYLADQEKRKGKDNENVAWTRMRVNKHIINAPIGSIHLPDLKDRHVDAWFTALGDARKPRKGETEEQALQRSQSSANRQFTTLKAGLNFAFRKRRVSTQVWQRVEPHKGADVPRERYLELEECKRLTDACPGDFKLMIWAGLHSAARYNELCLLKVANYSSKTHQLRITKRAHSKSKGHYINLTPEADAFFAAVCADRDPREPMFVQSTGIFKGQAWKHGQERSPMRQASKLAKIEPAIGFHCLRHTVASHLAMAGTPMLVISHMLGHKDTRMVESTYGHLSPSYVSDTIRANMPSYA
jgi:integrase